MATIEKRKSGQYRAKVRRNGIVQTQTFTTRRAAEEWATELEGRIISGEIVRRRPVQAVTLGLAIEWFLDRLAPKDPNIHARRRVNFQDATAFLRDTKNGEMRTVPLWPGMVRLLESLLRVPRNADGSLPAAILDRAVFPPQTGRGVSHAFAAA